MLSVQTNAAALAQTFQAYADIYGPRHGKSIDQLLIENGRKLAVELYNQTAAVAPTPAKIAADVKKQGWRIPKRFPDGRLGRGSPKQWLAGSAPKRSRGRPRKSASSSSLPAPSSKPTLEQMQAFVIKRRVNALLYVASGWLGAVQDLGGSLKQSSGNVQRTRGRAEVTADAIYIVNDTSGITVVNQRYGIVRKAIQARIADIRVYLAKHLAPSAFRKAA